MVENSSLRSFYKYPYFYQIIPHNVEVRLAQTKMNFSGTYIIIFYSIATSISMPSSRVTIIFSP